MLIRLNASEHFEKGKRQNFLGDGTDGTEDHIGKIIDTYQYRKEEDRYSRRVSMEEITEKNDCNLNISRYISTQEPEKEIILDDINTELASLEEDIRKAKDKHNEFLKQLQLKTLPIS